MNAVEVHNVWKKYRIGTISSVWQLGARYWPWRNVRPSDDGRNDLWALSDVSFSVKQGEGLGIIGRNGAGKTTLFRILAGVTEATRGRFTVRGRVAPLIDLNAGIRQELTGRENIYLNAAFLGMRRAEIRRRFDEIVNFAGLEDFINTPVKKYSSGMVVRLGFSVAAHLEPDILLIDEVLSVGDSAFQRKCIDRIAKLRAQGVTLLMVSHNMRTIQASVARCVLLDKGKIIAEGPPSPVIAQYHLGAGTDGQVSSELPPGNESDRNLKLVNRFVDWETGEVDIEAVWIQDKGGQIKSRFDYREKADLCIRFIRPQPLSPIRGFLAVSFVNERNINCMGARLKFGDHGTPETLPDSGVWRITFDPLQLVTGRYFLSIVFFDELYVRPYSARHYGYLEVLSDFPSQVLGEYSSLTLPPVTWRLERSET